MNPMIQCKPTILPLFIAGVLACFGLLPGAQAVVPAPDGGYAGFNTAEGQNALFGLTTGTGNVAVGWASLFSDTMGNFNTAIGTGALLFNTANDNTATGAGALLFNNSGTTNTANGVFALHTNTTGSRNTSVGFGACYSNTTGDNNTAIGFRTLFANNGAGNTAIGTGALFSNISGTENTAVGYNALLSNTGTGNTAIGTQALRNNTSGSFNIVLLGGQNLTTGDFNIDIGNNGVAGESNTIRIGNPLHTRAFIAGIDGATVAGGTPVFINSDGQLGTITSSARFKQDVRQMNDASEVLFALKPVTFRYKKEIDSAHAPQFGLVAEDVEKVNPNLIVRDKEGKPYSVRYDAVNAMLLNEFLKEHKKVENQEATITRLTNDFQRVSTQQRNEIQLLSAQLKEQAAQIQKVSAQLEASKSSALVVNNP